MIDVKQLRIGNWVSFKGLWNGQVKEVSAYGMILIKDNGGFFDDENIQPVPITKELLYKMGAEDFSDGESISLNNRLIGYAECRNVFYDKATSVDIVSVHQYQNLIYALTGSEIEVNL